jgi:hypothetical protein
MKTYERVELQLHHSLSQHYLEVSGQLHAPAALSLGKEPPVPIGKRLGGPLPEIDLRLSRPKPVLSIIAHPLNLCFLSLRLIHIKKFQWHMGEWRHSSIFLFARWR